MSSLCSKTLYKQLRRKKKGEKEEGRENRVTAKKEMEDEEG